MHKKYLFLLVAWASSSLFAAREKPSVPKNQRIILTRQFAECCARRYEWQKESQRTAMQGTSGNILNSYEVLAQIVRDHEQRHIVSKKRIS